MMQKGYGNFAFLFDIDRELYEDMAAMDCHLPIDYRWTGLRICGALEHLVRSVIRHYRLDSHLPPSLSLRTQLDRLADPELQELARDPVTGKPPRTEALLPSGADIITYTAPNDKGEDSHYLDDYYSFLYQVGSAFIDGNRPAAPQSTYHNTVLAMQCLHRILIAFYNAENVPDFDCHSSPIGAFVIDARDTAADIDSGCRNEILAHTVGRNGEPETYALLRQYCRKELDADFYNQIRALISPPGNASIPGLPRIRELTPAGADGDYYFLAYIFPGDARMLSNELLRQMDLSQRLQLCKDLVNTFASLHAASMYHRHLDPTCVYLYRRKDRWIPYIVKFDHGGQKSTPQLLLPAVASYLCRFLPNSLPKGKDDPGWDKVDVYSLGVLMTDILFGRLTANDPATVNFRVIQLPLSVPLGRILGRMWNDFPQHRPSMAEVERIFQTEVL